MCHITDKVRNHVTRQVNTDISIIPGGLTSHLQPADVSWNKPFKAAYKELYNAWMISGEKSYTPAGNMRAPDKALYLQWVIEAWSQLSVEVVKKSFMACGISVSTDGSQECDIHCTKEGQLAAEARTTIAQKTMALHGSNDYNALDPFADIEDEDELANNELVIEED